VFYAVLIPEETKALNVIEYLIGEGVEAGLLDDMNQTPLYYSAREGKADVSSYLVRDGGCKINQVDSHGQTPLFYAAREGHSVVCRALVGLGADPDHVDAKGQTPLFYAVKAARFDSTEFLISIGADVNHEDIKGESPLSLAKRSGKKAILNLMMDGKCANEDSLKKPKKKEDEANNTHSEKK